MNTDSASPTLSRHWDSVGPTPRVCNVVTKRSPLEARDIKNQWKRPTTGEQTGRAIKISCKSGEHWASVADVEPMLPRLEYGVSDPLERDLSVSRDWLLFRDKEHSFQQIRDINDIVITGRGDVKINRPKCSQLCGTTINPNGK